MRIGTQVQARVGGAEKIPLPPPLLLNREAATSSNEGFPEQRDTSCKHTIADIARENMCLRKIRLPSGEARQKLAVVIRSASISLGGWHCGGDWNGELV